MKRYKKRLTISCKSLIISKFGSFDGTRTRKTSILSRIPMPVRLRSHIYKKRWITVKPCLSTKTIGFEPIYYLLWANCLTIKLRWKFLQTHRHLSKFSISTCYLHWVEIIFCLQYNISILINYLTNIIKNRSRRIYLFSIMLYSIK